MGGGRGSAGCRTPSLSTESGNGSTQHLLPLQPPGQTCPGTQQPQAVAELGLQLGHGLLAQQRGQPQLPGWAFSQPCPGPKVRDLPLAPCPGWGGGHRSAQPLTVASDTLQDHSPTAGEGLHCPARHCSRRKLSAFALEVTRDGARLGERGTPTPLASPGLPEERGTCVPLPHVPAGTGRGQGHRQVKLTAAALHQ